MCMCQCSTKPFFCTDAMSRVSSLHWHMTASQNGKAIYIRINRLFFKVCCCSTCRFLDWSLSTFVFGIAERKVFSTVVTASSTSRGSDLQVNVAWFVCCYPQHGYIGTEAPRHRTAQIYKQMKLKKLDIIDQLTAKSCMYN